MFLMPGSRARLRSVSTLNGQNGNLQLVVPPLGRLTLASGTPVMSASQAARSTVYYTPYAGAIVPIYNGVQFLMLPFNEISQATTDTTKSPAAVANNSVYDIFVWNDNGTIRATRGPAWSNSTTRGYTLTMVNGILLNTSSITNGPYALRGTWVGTIASNGTATIDYIFGAAASGGTAAVLNVWNAYNRVTVGTTVIDNGTTYTYSSSTVRQARASAGNQISFVLGSQEDSVQFFYDFQVLTASTLQSTGQAGVGFDVTNAFSVQKAVIQTPVAAIMTGTNSNSGVWNVGIGTHILAAVEAGDGSTSVTFNDNSTNALSATLRM